MRTISTCSASVATRQSTLRSRCSARVSRGVTLLEITVALAIIALLFAAIVPSYGRWIAQLEVRHAAEAFAEALALARSEAIKHNGRAHLCKSIDGRTCTAGGGWESGWLVFLDENRNGTLDNGEAVVRKNAPTHLGITVRGNQPLATYVSFTALGHARLLSGALQIGTVTVCRRGYDAYHVVLASAGRVRVEHRVERCP